MLQEVYFAAMALNTHFRAVPACRTGPSEKISVTHKLKARLQALVYDILPSTTAVFSFTPSGPENCQLTSSFIAGAQTVVTLLQTQISHIRRLFRVGSLCTLYLRAAVQRHSDTVSALGESFGY